MNTGPFEWDPFEWGLRGAALAGISCLHAVAALAVIFASLPWPARAALLAAIAVSLWRVSRARGRLAYDGRDWWWQQGEGPWVGPLRLADGGYRGRRFMILHLRGPSWRRRCIVQRAGHCVQQWRRLAVLLH